MPRYHKFFNSSVLETLCHFSKGVIDSTKCVKDTTLCLLEISDKPLVIPNQESPKVVDEPLFENKLQALIDEMRGE